MERTSDTRLPAAKLVAAMAIVGTVGAFAVEAGLDPVTTVFWRCAFGTVFLGAWCLIRGYLPARDLSSARLALAALGGVCMVLSWIAFFAGFAMTSIATTTIVYHIQPFFVVLIGVLFLKERIGARSVIGSLLGLAGVGVILAGRLGAAHGAEALLGMAAVLHAARLRSIASDLEKSLRAGAEAGAGFTPLREAMHDLLERIEDQVERPSV